MSNFFTKLASTVGIATIVVAGTSASLVSAASEFLPYAEALATNSVIGTQSSESGYRLGANITRAELAKVVANLGDITATECTGTVFSDVGTSLGDLCGSIEGLADAGVVSTSAATFRPNANVTRAEMTKMILGALGETPSDVDAGYMDVASLGDLAGYINRANEIGCAASASYFRPNATASRGEAFKIAACVAQLDVETTTPTTPTVPPTTSTGVTSTGAVGSLAVSLSGTALAQYVPMNASSVKVGSVNLTAGSSDVTIRSLTVNRSGLGNSSDIVAGQGIRAAQNGAIISSSSDYYNSTSQNGNIYFYPALVVKAGTSTSVDILVNLNGASNSQHQFTVTAVNGTAATVTGTPTTLGLLNTTSYSTSSVTVAGTYSYSVTPGKTQQTIAKVDLTSGNRDVMVNGFTLTRSAGTDLTRRFSNVAVFKNGVKVGTASVTSDKIWVTGLATELASGNFQAFEVKADILVDGSAGTNTLTFKLDSSSDIYATEVATGYATQTSGFASFNEVVTFSSVDVTYSKVSTANQTVSPGTSNVTLFNGKLTSTVPLTVKQLIITPSAGATYGASAFANDQLSVKLNGSEIATITSSDFLSGSTTAIPKVVSIPVDASTAATITIVGTSVKNTPGVNGAYTFTVKLSDVRDSANNSVALLSDSLVGDKTTIQSPTMTLKNATVAAPTNNTISSTSNQEVGRFAITADGDAIRVTKVSLIPSNAATLTGIVSSSSIELWNADTNTKISATTSLSSTGLVTFDSMTNDIVKDGTQNFKVIFTSVNSLDAYYGQSLMFSTSTGEITTTTVNSSATVTTAGSATLKPYTIGVVPPTVLLTASPLAQNSKIATLRVTNVDSNTGITLSNVVLTFQARSTAQGNFAFNGNLCLRDLGSSASCGGVGTTTAQAVTQAGGTFTVNIAGSTLSNATNSLTKNGGYVDYEVYLDNAPLWVTGDNANVTITSVNYVPAAAPQSYVGVAGASATSTK